MERIQKPKTHQSLPKAQIEYSQRKKRLTPELLEIQNTVVIIKIVSAKQTSACYILCEITAVKRSQSLRMSLNSWAFSIKLLNLST